MLLLANTKMKLPGKYHRTVSSFVLCLIAAAICLSPSNVEAQSSETKEKIALMSAALRARDAGDLNVAKENLEALLRLNPGDRNVQNLLNAVNTDISRQNSGLPTVYGQAASVTAFEPAATSRGSFGSSEPAAIASMDPAQAAELDNLLASQQTLQKVQIEAAEETVASAKKLIKTGRYDEAEAILVEAKSNLPENTATAFVLEDIQEARGSIYVVQGKEALENNDVAAARALAVEYQENLGEDKQLKAFEGTIDSVVNSPWRQDPEALSPGYVENQETVETLLVKGRAQMLYGDYDGAMNTFREVEARDPNNAPAKALQLQVTKLLQETSYLDHEKTREEMLQEVNRSWQRPQIFEQATRGDEDFEVSPLMAKIATIEIPSVKFAGIPLSRVVETLSELSVEFDVDETDPKQKGVNMVLLAPPGQDPPVSITLRNLSLDKVLDFTVETVGYQWDVKNEAVIVTKGSGDLTMETEFFPISRGVVIRLTGVEDGGGAGGGAADPFAPAAPAASGPSSTDTEAALKSFFQRAGVDFEGTPGSSLAFDGTQLIVTQTARNLEKMRNILRRYDQPKQVEIEAKFMEVNQGALDELGFSWDIRSGSVTSGFDASGNPITSPKTEFQTSNRSLASAFAINRAGTLPLQVSQGGVDVINSDLAAPSIPNTIDLATGAMGVFSTFGIIDGVNVDLVINALSREQGTDLLSSPRLTVLSGRTAQIIVAQELRYPENYGDIESEVGTGNANGGGSAGVTITAGTPQDFTVRNVGVEMEVTPTVEENENISLKLEPRVTEFEGFVEYGGPSIAISGATTVTVPSGFFQPIFSTRQVRTEVTVYDGATVVIGGLVREEVLTVNDKVPVLGDIPLIGRLFQNKGESSQKRNLLIFVTANLISPGGSPQRQRLKNVEPNQLFKNPIIVTPGGGISRELTE